MVLITGRSSSIAPGSMTRRASVLDALERNTRAAITVNHSTGPALERRTSGDVIHRDRNGVFRLERIGTDSRRVMLPVCQCPPQLASR